MKFKIVTLFPELFEPFIKTGIIAKAIEKKVLTVELIQLRDFSTDKKYKRVDDYLYGGGAGMLIKPDVLEKSLKKIKQKNDKVICLTPVAEKLSNEKIKEYSSLKSIIIYCGRYEGLDSRFVNNYIDERVSIGDFVMMGGECPAMLLIETITRRIDNVINAKESFLNDSFEHSLLEEEQYTRPVNFKKFDVPDILLSGNHKLIEDWRRYSSLKNTYEFRPDLFEKLLFTGEDRSKLKEIYKEKYCGYNQGN